MLCKDCAGKSAPPGLGFCSKCAGVTPSPSFSLCDSCATSLNQCKHKQHGTGGTGGGPVPTPSGPSAYRVVLNKKDSGKTISGVRVGEQIEISLDEDRYSGREFAVDSYDRWMFSSQGQTFVYNSSNPQYGQRVFTFDVTGSGSGDIELHEVQYQWSRSPWGGGSYVPVPNGQTFKVTVDVT